MKLTSLGIVAIGLVATFLVFLAIFMFAIRPAGWQIEDHRTYLDNANNEIAKEKQVAQRIVDAQRIVNEARVNWSRYQAKYGLPRNVLDLSRDRVTAAVQAWQLPGYYGHRFMGFAERKGDVNLLSFPTIGKLPPNPNEVLESYFMGNSMPIFIARIDLPNQRVRGTFPSILRHVERWNDFTTGLVLTDGLVFNGTSPYLVGTYKATLYVMPNSDRPNKDKVKAMQSDPNQTSGGFGGTAPGVGTGANPFTSRGPAPVAPGGGGGGEGGGESGGGEGGGGGGGGGGLGARRSDPGL